MNNKLKEVRLAIGLNQKEFASKLGIKQSYYSSLEQGKKEPSMRVIESLWPLGVSSEWFFHDKGAMFIDEFDVGNIHGDNIAKNNNEMYANFVQGVSQNTCDLIENNRFFLDRYYNETPLQPYHYEYMQIKYFNTLSVSKVKELLSLEKEAYEEQYNSHISLVKVLHYLNPPTFLKEKFRVPEPYPEHMKDYVKEFKEETEGLKNDKLKNILLIIRLKEDKEYLSSRLGKLINYMDMYKDFILGKLKADIVIDYKDGKIPDNELHPEIYQ